MTYVITSACIDVMDQSCVAVCPVDCIISAQTDRMCFVHPLDCIDCGACESACPVGAIFLDTQVPANEAEFTALNAIYFTDESAARARVDELAGEGL